MSSVPSTRLAARAVGGFGTSIVAGAILGAAAWLADQLQWPLNLIIPANNIGVWLGIAFTLGASARTIPTGALRGLIGLLAAVSAYYLLFATLGSGFRAIGAGHAATVWGAVALLAGPVMGGAGAVWRYGAGWPRSIAVALFSSALVAEGVVFGVGRLIHIDRISTDPGALQMAVEIVVGAILPALLLRPGERLHGYLATATLAVAASASIGPVSNLVRGLADRF